MADLITFDTSREAYHEEKIAHGGGWGKRVGMPAPELRTSESSIDGIAEVMPSQGSLRDFDRRSPEQQVLEDVADPEIVSLALRGIQNSRARVARELKNVDTNQQQKLF